MTIATIHIDRDRKAARVWCDTLHALDGRPASDAPKFLVLGHLPAVLLCRGSHRFLWLIAGYVPLNAYRDFDDLCDLLPAYCRAAVDEHIAKLGSLDGARAPELVAIGASKVVGGYAAARFDGVDFAPCRLRPATLPRRSCGRRDRPRRRLTRSGRGHHRLIAFRSNPALPAR